MTSGSISGSTNGTGTAATAASAIPTTTLFRLSAPRAKNLLVVNKGPGAVTIPREGGAWDLLEIYFAPSDIEKIEADPSTTTAEYVIFETYRKIRKFSIIGQLFKSNPFWKAYDAVLMLDDDVAPAGCSIQDIFELFAKTDCRVGQPALTRDSFYGHPIHLKNDNFVWRRTNCAELMCPIMTREGLIEYLPIFEKTKSGFGLDDYWSFQEWIKGYGVAVLDGTPVHHGRPVGGSRAYEGLVLHEGSEFMRINSIPRYFHSCFGGVLAETSSHTPADLDPTVSGYPKGLSKDSRFRKYLSDQTAIIENEAILAGDCDDLEVLKTRLEVIVNLAAVSLYMATREFRHRGPILSTGKRGFWDRISFWR